MQSIEKQTEERLQDGQVSRMAETENTDLAASEKLCADRSHVEGSASELEKLPPTNETFDSKHQLSDDKSEISSTNFKNSEVETHHRHSPVNDHATVAIPASDTDFRTELKCDKDADTAVEKKLGEDEHEEEISELKTKEKGDMIIVGSGVLSDTSDSNPVTGTHRFTDLTCQDFSSDFSISTKLYCVFRCFFGFLPET